MVTRVSTRFDADSRYCRDFQTIGDPHFHNFHQKHDSKTFISVHWSETTCEQCTCLPRYVSR